MSKTFRLPAGQIATVTAHASGAASFWSITEANVPGAPVAVLAGATASVGPFAAPKIYVMAGEFGPSVAFTSPDPLALAGVALSAPAIAGATAFSMAGDVFLIPGDGVPVDYTDGTPPATGEGTAAIGSLYSDYTNGKLYINGGTQAQPVWKIVTSAV